MFDATLDIGPIRLGASHDLVQGPRGPYLERWILWFGLGTLRLHKFHRGDDDRAPHDHPWAFVTFPLRSYVEKVYTETRGPCYALVERFKFHYRPAKHMHIVAERHDRAKIWTIVLTGLKTDKWGFWPLNKDTCKREYVYWRDWK